MALRAAAEHGARTALVDGLSGESFTYAELEGQALSIASALVGRGFREGDVVSLCMPNIPAAAAVTLGALAAGMTVAMANPGSAEPELDRHVAMTGAKVLFTVPQAAPAALAVAARNGVREVIVAGGAPGCAPLAELLSAPHGPLPAVSEDATAFIFPSSGTTDLPKGVELTHRGFATMMRQQGSCLRFRSSDTSLAVTPVFHVMGFQSMLMNPLLAGARVVMMPRFDPRLLIDLIERYRVTMMVGAPPLMPALLAEQARGRLESLELLGCGGSALPRTVELALRERFPGATVSQGWGLTETTGAISIPRRGWSPPVGSVGKLLPNSRLRVVDPVSGRDMGVNEQGELWVAGPHVMRGYAGNPEATAAMVSADGWLRTGDLGRVDEEGCIFLTGRLKELIKVNGFQVAPAELEAVLVSHPAVADAAVVGRPDERRGEAPVAFVVKSGEVSEKELKAWVAERVTAYKRLRDVKFIDAVPKSPAGKILRRLLV
jgi:acyl-CoA synthetase (AMP-forming)/AMP-acid ligase II